MKKIFRIVITIILCLIAWITYLELTWEHSSKKLLPKTATEIQELRTDCFPSDFLDCMKAKIPDDDYYAYAHRLGLTTKYDPELHGSCIIPSFDNEPDWWNPPLPNETTRLKLEGNFIEVVTFENGYLYYFTSDT